MSEPKRIQRKRTKGWRMPPNTVYVGRPTKWGNPYAPGKKVWISVDETYIVKDKADAIRLYREWYAKHQTDCAALRGKDLACWCPLNQPCHADVLLELANTGRRIAELEAGEKTS